MSLNGGKLWVLYGGAGFIGQHLAHSILNRSEQDRVHLLDIQSPAETSWKLPLEEFVRTGRLTLLACDVRNTGSMNQNSANFDVMVNLAAIHREPGHRSEEYFETNVSGAQNVCRLAENVGCREILFTSSISVYGVHDRPVDEDSPAQPRTPYGQSKYEAEKIHLDWAKRTGGRLSIIRPGVVFGPGEEGNVTRLVGEMLKRDRVIRVKPDQPKAGIYIQELIEVILWLRRQPVADGESQLVNGVSNDNLTFNSYGRVLQEMRNLSRSPVTLPGTLLGLATSLMRPMAGLFPAGSKIHPERLSKLIRANDIRPAALTRMGYPFSWPLERALADWLDRGI